MSLFNKTVSFLAFMSCMPAAFAVTARPAVNMVSSTASRSRMPTMSATVSVTGTTTTTSSVLADTECIDAYKSCIESDDACGAGLAECTNKILFHAKMPQCISTLAQCSTAGINSLFGTSSYSALSESTTSDGEITGYTYPTDGSVLGQMITAAAISNRYDTSTCVKRYTSCLQKDSVCGADFELCTTDSEFKKQKLFCDSTLARCQSEGKMELFGSTDTTANPVEGSRLRDMISEGASLAAINAVSTCYKVVDQCILNACATNPLKCMDGASGIATQLAQAIGDGTSVTQEMLNTFADNISSAQVSGYIRNACESTIGSNKYCYATFLGNGKMPTASQLRDAENQEAIYDEAYAARMNTSMKAKLSDLIAKFDTKAKEKCTETIKSCAMRVCGSGNGAVCYSQVFGATDKSINNDDTRKEIETGCAAIVNTDAYCQYAAANLTGTGAYSYSYINTDAFGAVFPEYDSTATTQGDPIGVVASLNATLSNSYSEAALAQKKKQCQTVATSCVKSMCGSDYVNCYRNRTDIYSNLTQSGDETFNDSMNKVGGVLDYTIVLGLCLDTVKNASVCEDHLAIETARIAAKTNKNSSVWGGKSEVRDGWLDAGSASAIEGEIDERIAVLDENGNPMCRNDYNEQGVCNQYSASMADKSGDVDSQKFLFDEPMYIDTYTYHQSEAAETLFQDLVYDIEKEAQALYNAKLTKEQNMCMASNAGGIMGNKDSGSTYMWAKLRSKKVPADYSVKGLEVNDFIASNDLYGSFCRIRVTIQSDDKKIQEWIAGDGKKWANAYFAVGDAFTCGSWIPNEGGLDDLAEAVAQEETEDMETSQKKLRGWLTALGTVGSAVGGGYLTNAIMDGDAFGGLTGLGENRKSNNDVANNDAKWCISNVEDAIKNINKNSGYSSAVAAMQRAQLVSGLKDSYSDNDWKALDNAIANLEDIETAPASLKTGYTSEATRQLTALKSKCQDYGKKTSVDNEVKGRAWKNAIGSAVTAAAGGITVYYATKDIQDANLTAAEKAAYEEWMNNVGKHIHCYIGGDEAGSYGDIITTSIE